MGQAQQASPRALSLPSVADAWDPRDVRVTPA